MITLPEEHPWIRLWKEEAFYHLDVREMLENGSEPYSYIMACLNQLEAGETLVVHALFEPLPLKVQAEKMGFQTLSSHPGTDHWTLEIANPG